MLMQAIGEYARKTCIRFQRTSGRDYHIRLMYGRGYVYLVSGNASPKIRHDILISLDIDSFCDL